MHSYEYDAAVFIGRFQPYHNGHQKVIEAALDQAQRVFVLIGSSNAARSLRNPFTYLEREEMIRQYSRVTCLPLPDFTYRNELWIEEATRLIRNATGGSDNIALIGHAKDESSYYLNMFPQWGAIEAPNYKGVNSTDIRHCIFDLGYLPTEELPEHVHNQIDSMPIVLSELREEYRFIRNYQSGWLAAPYPPTFVTTDAVVVQSGHVLMIRRGARPGLGQWALPGGFLNPKETLIDCCIRELREETKLKVPTPVLLGSMHERRTFDDPFRSSRGRTVTTAFYFHLKPGPLPKVKGSDDADKAKWIPLADLNSRQIYEDHYHIIRSLLGD